MSSRYEEAMRARPQHQPLRVGRLTDELTARAERELGETDEVRPRAIAELRTLVQEQRELHCWQNDFWLLQFLRARKFNVKKAFALLQHFFETKKSYSEVYGIVNMEDLMNILRTGAAYCLPYRDEEGCPIVIFQTCKWNPDDFTLATGLLLMTALLIFCLEDPATQVTGVHIMMDVKGLTLKQMRCVTPRYINLFSKALRNTLPVRFKGIHIYNESILFQYIWSLLKIFLTEKIKNRAHFHGDSQKHLHKHIPKCILPAQYGGDNINFSATKWAETELSPFYDKFSELLSHGYQD